MRLFVIISVLMLCLTGCNVVTSPEARQQIEQLNTNIKTMADKAIESAEKGEAIAGQIATLKEEIQKGTIDAAAATLRMQTLVAEGSLLYQNFQKAQTDIVAAQAEIKAIQQEHGVPGWQIGLNAGLAVLSALAGSRWLAAKAGIQVLTSAIEKGTDQSEIKKLVSKANNSEVEKAVRKV